MRLCSLSVLAAGVGLLCAGFAAQPAAAQSIGINFVDGGDFVQDAQVDSLQPAESAGVAAYAQVNWNNLGRWGQAVNLKDATGNPTGVTATWDSPNTWRTNTGTSTPDRKLMYGYVDSNNSQNDDTSVPYNFWATRANQPQVYATNLSAWLTAAGATSYTVVIYVDGDAADGRTGEYWLQGVTGTDDPPATLDVDLTPHVFLRDNANFSGTYTLVPLSASTPTTAGNGNYIVFTGVKADRFLLRTEEANWRDGTVNGFRSPINGFQIIAVDDNAISEVTVAAKNDAAEPSTNGAFTVTRTGGSFAADLLVRYAVGGSATSGADFAALAGTVIIPANQNSATVTVNTIDDGLVEDAETVTLTLEADPKYTIGTPGDATINMTSDDATATVTIQATDNAAAEFGGDNGSLVLTRTGPTTFALPVDLATSGTATAGTDYVPVPKQVVIPAGQASTTVSIVPSEDGVAEGAETVTVTVVANDPQYLAGSPDVDTVTIADNGTWGHWSKQLPLTFVGFNAAGPVANAPVLVVLTPERVGNYVGFNADGSDLRFTNAAGDVSMAYEIEKWDPAGASYIWVQVPQIAAATDSMLMLWGNATAASAQNLAGIWGGDYIGVWHLNAPSGDGTYPDSAGRNPGAVNNGGVNVAGLIGGAVNFNGAGTYIDTGNVENLATYTVMTWTRSPAAPSGDAPTGPVHREANYQINWNHGDENFRGSVAMATEAGWYPANLKPMSADTWYFLAGTYDGETLRAYRDGAENGVNETPSGLPAEEVNSLKFGRHAAADQFFNGIVDEVRVLSTPQSADWIAVQYAAGADNLIGYGGYGGTVTIAATDANAAEPANNGQFTVSRTGGDANAAVAVHYTVSGTALPGSDYEALSGVVTILPGQTQATIDVDVLNDTSPEDAKTIVVTLVDRAQYDLGAEVSATVNLLDNDTFGDWAQKRKIEFGGYTGTTELLNFPVMVTLTPESTSNYSGFAPNGADLRFANSTQTVAIPYEIEQWDPNGTSVIWVRVPRLASQSDSIWMYWNNPAAADAQQPGQVWINGYLAVYHLGPEVDGKLPDSTSAKRDGTNLNTTSTPGVAGAGRAFNGTNAYINCNSPFLSGLQEFTLTGWINPSALGNRIGLFGQNDAVEFGFDGGTNIACWTAGGGFVGPAYPYGLGEWHYATIMGNASGLSLLVDAIPLEVGGNATGSHGSSGFTVKIGSAVWDASGNWYNGLMDEVRMSNVARPADWIAAEMASMNGTLLAESCKRPRFDKEGDGDVDQEDFGYFQACYSGFDTPAGDACKCMDINEDGDVDTEDLAAFASCVSGPAIPANADCDSPPQ